MRLILYSKPGCHLCEGLQEKLEQIQSLPFQLEVRDITSRDDWFQAFQYEIPVLQFDRSSMVGQPAPNQPETSQPETSQPAPNQPAPNQSAPNQPETGQPEIVTIPRPSPRASVAQLERLLQRYLSGFAENGTK